MRSNTSSFSGLVSEEGFAALQWYRNGSVQISNIQGSEPSVECPRIIIKTAVSQDLGCAPHLSICGAVSGLGVKISNSCFSSYCNNNKIIAAILKIGSICYCSVEESPYSLKEHYQCSIASLQEGSMRLTPLICVSGVWRCSQMCFNSFLEPICAVGQGVAALCCATNEDKSWIFQGYSLTGVSQAFTLFLLFGGFFCCVISGGFELPVNINYQFGALGLCKMCRAIFDKGPSAGCMKGLSHLSGTWGMLSL